MPLAFIVMLCVVELLRKIPAVARAHMALRIALVLAIVLSTAAAFLSGYQASSSLPNLAQEAEAHLSRHHAAGRFLLINAILLGTFCWTSCIAKRGRAAFSALYWAFVLAQLALTVWVGTMGGDLVFSHGLGVAGAPHSPPPQQGSAT